MNPNAESNSTETARVRWLEARRRYSELADNYLRPGNGYGDPFTQQSAAHQVETARNEAESLFLEFQRLDRRDVDSTMLKLQRSQHLATWASFVVAAVVGLATVVSTLVALLG